MEITMKKYLTFILTILLFLGFSAYASQMNTHHQKSENLHFYHGLKHPDSLISVENFSADEIEFKIRRAPEFEYLYHTIIDENETPIAEGWYPAYKINTDHYTVKMKPKKGKIFQSDKKYRLCVTTQNPEYTSRYTSNIQCFVDFEFVLPEK